MHHPMQIMGVDPIANSPALRRDDIATVHTDFIYVHEFYDNTHYKSWFIWYPQPVDRII